MFKRFMTVTCTLGALVIGSARSAQAELLLAEDFFYAETPNKPLGGLAGFQRGDYGGGYGGWTSTWLSVNNSTITGPGCLSPECTGDSDLYQGVVANGSPNVLDREYALPASAGNTIYFGGVIRENANTNSRSTIFLQGATVTNFNNFKELDANSIGIGIYKGGLRGLLGETTAQSEGTVSNDGQFHTVIGKLQINASGANESLTVWLDPTGPETGGTSISVNNVNVISSVSSLGSIDGSPIRLWNDGGLTHFDNIAVGTTWNDVANFSVPRPTLELDTTNGFARLKNASGKSFNSFFYSLQSASGSLLPGGWNSLSDQGNTAWTENNSNSGQLVESRLIGVSSVANGANIPLGPIWWKGATTLDLIPQFGTDTGFLNQGGVQTGLLNRLPITTVVGPYQGDLTGDGAVDAADAGIMFGGWGNARNVGDINGDNVVDAADAGIMFGEWTGDLAPPGANAATAEYNAGTGELRISSAGAVNVFVQSASGKITPLSPAPAVPVGLLTNNASRVGITNLGPINLTNFSFGNIGTGLAQSDLKLVYTPALGQKGVEIAAGAVGFSYIPEPASLGLVGLGVAGLLASRKRS